MIYIEISLLSLSFSYNCSIINKNKNFKSVNQQNIRIRGLRMILPAPINNALAKLTQQGFEAFVVGGCVRDAMMGIDPKDFDIATNATPTDVQRVFIDFPVFETGIQHGTVTVLIDSHPLEITTYRIDGEYIDKRRPLNVEFTNSIIEDLSRRDFTINAMAYSNETGLVDPFNGRKAINEKLICCVGEPTKRFEEDALRILRAVRFAAVFGFEIETRTKDALMKAKETILTVATERITAEFTRMICGDYIESILLEYADLIAVFIPEIIPSIQFDQKNPYHAHDVYTHTVKVVSNVPPYLSLRLAALFHDIAKPQTHTTDINGVGHFYGHQILGARTAKTILDRMKFDNETKQRTYELVYFHDIQIKSEPKAVKRVLNRFSESFFEDLIDLKKADILGQNPEMKGRIKDIDNLLAIYKNVIKENACFKLKDLAINGNDLISIGIPGGRKIGKILMDCLNQVINERIQNNKEEMIRYVKEIFLNEVCDQQ